MPNGLVIQFAVLSVAVVIVVVSLYFMRRRRIAAPAPVEAKKVVTAARPKQPQPIAAPKPVIAAAQPSTSPTPKAPTPSAIPTPPVVQKPVVVVQERDTSEEERQARILAGISENIRKSMETRPVAPYSPMSYQDSKPRNPEYVRVKKEIITPHAQIRFSILKDWVQINMLAIFRRAGLQWKSAEDLVAPVPAYLEAEVEIVNDQVLLIGTRGYDEQLAIPIQTLDSASGLRECFEFITDVRTAPNTPAVVLRSGDQFEIASKGIIAQSLLPRSGTPHAGLEAENQGPNPELLVYENVVLARSQERV